MACGVEPQSAVARRRLLRPTPAQQRLQPRDEFSESERLGEVVVTADPETGEALDKPVPGRQKQHGRLHALRTERLAEVAAVGVGQADVHHERVGRSGDGTLQQICPVARCFRPEALFGKAANENSSQLGVVFDDQDSRFHHSSRRIVPNRSRDSPREASATATIPPRTAAPASAPRKVQGRASRSGGGSKTCCSIATSISASSHPSRTASMSAAPSTREASLQTNAATDRSEAPSASMVASSWRRSATATSTNSPIAAAARRTANASSIRLIPARSTVVIELTVCAVCWRMFLTVAPELLVAAATRRETATGPEPA